MHVEIKNIYENKKNAMATIKSNYSLGSRLCNYNKFIHGQPVFFLNMPVNEHANYFLVDIK